MTITNGQPPAASERVWLGETIKVSNSEIQTYKSCRRRWYLAYYRELGLKRAHQESSGPRSLGSRVHVALEAMYAKDENPLDVLRDIYEADIDRYLQEGRFQSEIDAVRKEYDLANAMVEGYMLWAEEQGVDDGIEVVASETVIEVDSHIPGIKLRGKLDQRVVRQSDGARLFRDFKTVPDLTGPPKILPLDEQMKFYHLLEYIESLNATGDEPAWRTDGALYMMLRKVKRTATAKPPFYGQLEVHHNIHEIRSMWKRVCKIIEELYDLRVALDAGGDHQYLAPPRPSRDCTWSCDFFAVCSMMDDGSDSEGMLEAYYEHLDPHERYNTEEEEVKA